MDKLPTSVTFLGFGHNVNRSIDMLPLSMTAVSFGYNFNQSVDMLPPLIKYLDFYNKCLLKILYVLNRTHIFYKKI